MGTWFVYLALLFMAVAGPVFVVVDLLVDEGVGATALIGGGVTLFMTPLAIYFWHRVASGREGERRVYAVGRPATAEIVAVATTSVGDDAGVELTLRVSGGDFTPFVGRVSCLAEDDLRVGTVLQALVDPADNAFTIVGR